MDILDVAKPIFDFVAKFFAISLTVGGYSFTVGALFLWCFIFVVVVGFLKGLAD